MSSVPFDQLDGEIWYNGEFLPWKDAKIHVLTHGLHYASAVQTMGCASTPSG